MACLPGKRRFQKSERISRRPYSKRTKGRTHSGPFERSLTLSLGALRLFVTEGFYKRFKFFEPRLQIFLIISPAAYGSFKNWFGDVRIGGGANEFFLRMFVETQ